MCSKEIISSTLPASLPILLVSSVCLAPLHPAPHSKRSWVPRTLLSLGLCIFLISLSSSSFPGIQGAYCISPCRCLLFWPHLTAVPVPLNAGLHLLPFNHFALGLLTAIVILNPYQHGVFLSSVLYNSVRIQASRKERFFTAQFI